MEGSVLSIGYVALREQADGSYGEYFQGSLSLGAGGHYQVSNDDAWAQGCGWNPSFRLTVPAGWPSGLYAARCTTAQGFSYLIPFIVKVASNGVRGDFLVIANTNTWTAYNRWAGHSNYTFGDRKTLSYLRPNNHLLTGPRDHDTGNHLLRSEIWALDWLRREGYKVDVCTDLDWAAGNIQPQHYRGLILQTHPEYWSIGMRDLLARQLAQGMNLIVIGGNVIFRGVRNPSDTDGNERTLTGPQISTASDGSEQYLNDGGALRSLIGTAYNWGTPTPSPYAIFPQQAGHWIFQGVPGLGITGQSGSIGGPGKLGLAACGWEADTARIGTATADDPDFSPASTVLLGTGPGQSHDVTRTSPRSEDATGHMLCFTTSGGGFVFAAPSISFCASLAVDRPLQIMICNVLNYCLGSRYGRPAHSQLQGKDMEAEVMLGRSS